MTAPRPTARLALAALAAATVLAVSGCGFALRQEAQPEVLPTTTLAPTVTPEGVNPEQSPEVRPPPVLVEEEEGADGIVGAPVQPEVVVLTDEDYLVRQELDELVGPDAAPVCRVGASMAYSASAAIDASVDLESGQARTDIDQAAVRRELEAVLRDMRELARRLPEDGARITSAARLEEAFADLAGRLQATGTDEPVIRRFHSWWSSHAPALTEVASGLAAVCSGEPFVEYLGQWR